MNILHTKKFRHGSTSLALTIVIIAAVILVNAIFTALSAKFLWYIDMTSEQIYTLTDEAKALLDGMDQSQKVEIIFGAEKDVLEADGAQRLVLYTALEVADRYDNVTVKYVDVITNPSAVNPYKEHTGADITSTSVIIASGTECRVFAQEALFSYDGNTQETIGYNGEQRLVSALLAVTQLERPVACITINHRETDNPNIRFLEDLLDQTGFKVKEIDLAREEIPEDCRLLVVYDPQTDFVSADEVSSISELDKIDDFLDEQNSMMVFFDHDTPVLKEFEAFLDEWGIAIARQGDANLLIKDLNNSFDAQSGLTVVGQYVEDGALGSSITQKLRAANYPKSVLFPWTTAIRGTYDALYSDNAGGWTGSYYVNGVKRNSYDVFTSSPDAVAVANGSELSNAALEQIGLKSPATIPFSFMKITRETVVVDGAEVYSHLLACASTTFVTRDALTSKYGNHSVLAYACSIMGRDVISVSLDCKYFSDTEISNITAADAKQYTVVLTVVPAAVIFIAGIYIMVRRKYA